MKFPGPWKIEQTGPCDCVVTDANGRKLFYIVGDEGDGEEGSEYYREPSVLFWGSDDADTNVLLDELQQMMGALK